MTLPRFADRLARLFEGPRSILYLGASVTAQQKSYCHAFHELLCRATGYEHVFHRLAQGGGSSAFALSLLLRSLRAGEARYDIVFLEGLTGDLNLLVPATAAPAVIAATADAVRGRGGEVCVLKLPRMDRPADHPIAMAHDEAAAALGLPVIDLFGFGSPAEGAEAFIRQILRDGIHTSDNGSVLVGAAILGRLLAPDALWPASTPAPGYAEPLRNRLSGLRLVLDDLAWEGREGLERDAFNPPLGDEAYAVVRAPVGAPIAFTFPGYVAYFLFVSAPDSACMDLDFHGLVRRTSLLDRHGHFPHLHMKPIFRDFGAGEVIRMEGLAEIPDPNPVPEAHRHKLSPNKAIRFLGVLGVPAR